MTTRTIFSGSPAPSRDRGPVGRRLTVAGLALVGALLVVSCTQPVGEYDATRRGDLAFVRGELEEALAEYRLALLQGTEEPEVYARVAHTYARMGSVDEAADNYARAAAEDSVWADQAVADLVRLAHEAVERDDLFSVASAMQRALQFRPGLSVGELALPLARHYARNGEYGRALPFFQRALASVPADSAPGIMYETAEAYEQLGDCGRALVFFEQYREMIPAWRRGDVDWHVGNCAFRHAQNLLEDGEVERALRFVNTTVELGEPRSVQAPAYYEKGRIHSLLGDCDAALAAYRQVASADVGAAGSLVSRAERRIDQIRFGGFGEFDPDSQCGLPAAEQLSQADDGENSPARE